MSFIYRRLRHGFHHYLACYRAGSIDHRSPLGAALIIALGLVVLGLMLEIFCPPIGGLWTTLGVCIGFLTWSSLPILARAKKDAPERYEEHLSVLAGSERAKVERAALQDVLSDQPVAESKLRKRL